MNRTHTCGELRIENVGQTVTLFGWVHQSITLNGMTYVDLRDRSGITLVVVDAPSAAELVETEKSFGRDWVQVTGEVVERHCKDSNMGTGDIQISVSEVKILNANSLSIRRVIWVYEYFGLGMALKVIAYDIVTILAFVGYCFTLPFRFVWILCKKWIGK